MPAAPDVATTALIVSYNVNRHLKAAVLSVNQSRGQRAEVVVVDNCSSDGSADMIANEFPTTKLIRLDRNRGYAAANNIGLCECSSAFVLILNPDVILDPGAIETLSGFLIEHPEVGAAGPRLVRPNGRLDPAARRTFPTPGVAALRMMGLARAFPSSRVFARYNLGHLSPDSTHEIDSGTGACLMVRRDALEQVGGFDTDYFLYGEDLDLCVRLKSAGWRIYYVPQARAIHIKGASASLVPRASIDHFHNAMWLFYRKHYAAVRPHALNAVVWTAIRVRWMLMRIRAAYALRLGKASSSVEIQASPSRRLEEASQEA